MSHSSALRVLAIAVMTGSMAAVAPPIAAMEGQVTVRSSSVSVASYGDIRVTGDVVNHTSSRRFNIVVTATFLDSAGRVLGSTQGRTSTWSLAPNATDSFDMIRSGLTGFDHYSLSTTQGTIGESPLGPLGVQKGTPYTDWDDYRNFPVTLTNLSSFPAWYPSVGVVLYDSAARAIETSAAVPFSSVLSAGSSVVVTNRVQPGRWEMAAKYTAHGEAWATSSALGYLTSWSNYFDDTTPSFYLDIVWLAESGITGGCDTALFCPRADVSRGQMAAFLDRALHLPRTSSDYFTDDDASMFEASINRLAASGITGGCDSRRFCPNATVTREQMAAFLDRALHLPRTSIDYFTDDESSMFEASINRLAARGITGGCTTTRFCSAGLVSREQMAAFLHRGLD